MIGFVEVFPCGLALEFPWKDERWAVDEQYCVQPDCRCAETVLSFFRLADASGQWAPPAGENPALRYNHASQASEPAALGPSGSPPLSGLLAALKREHPDLNSQLKGRHSIMHSIYAWYYQELTRLRRIPQAKAAPQIGRNELGPCGSGRKYKQCCMNKPQSEGEIVRAPRFAEGIRIIVEAALQLTAQDQCPGQAHGPNASRHAPLVGSAMNTIWPCQDRCGVQSIPATGRAGRRNVNRHRDE